MVETAGLVLDAPPVSVGVGAAVRQRRQRRRKATSENPTPTPRSTRVAKDGYLPGMLQVTYYGRSE